MFLARAKHRWVLAAAISAVSLAAPEAMPEPRNLERSSDALIADGVRYAVSNPTDDAITVRDDRKRTARTVPTNGRCRTDDGHRGVFLVRCSRGQRLLTPGARRLRAIPGRFTTWDPEVDGNFNEIGTRWLRGSTRRSIIFYVNWHTGDRRSFGESSSDAYRDLDSRNLRRLPLGFIFESRRLRIRWARGRILVKRRGERERVLDRCQPECHSLSVGAGLLTWTRSNTAHAYVLRTGRRMNWTFDVPIGDRDRLFYGVQHTRRYVYFNVPESGEPGSAFQVQRERWRE